MMAAVFAGENGVLIVNESNSPYVKTVQALYPDIIIKPSLHTSAFQSFHSKKNVEVYKTQAETLVDANSEYRFEAHYIHTIVIAIDRDQTDKHITYFKDIFSLDSEINFNFGEENGLNLWDLPEAQHIVLSMAKALYGSYDVQSIAKDFHVLFKDNRFFANDDSKPISIMYDFEAVELIQNGRNIELIIPKDGTISFVGGILVYDSITLLNPTFNEVLLKNGIRLANGDANEHYPRNNEYSSAYFVEDIAAFNKASNAVGYTLRRNAFKTERYGFTDHKARAIFFLCFLIVMMFYIISINRRLTNLKIRHAIVGVCAFQITLVSMGCLKALNFDNPIIETILWYGYYYAFVYITVIYLYMAIISGKNKEIVKTPPWYILYVIISTLLVLMVSTNNFHGFVFTVYDYRDSTFDYNTGYYIVMSWIYITTCCALGILMYKVIKMPRKSTLILPFLMNFFTMAFMIGYASRIPIFYDFDFAYSINIIILLYIEACIQSKLLASNTHYKKMFSNSHLCMEIKDINDVTVERSLTSIDPTRDYILKKTGLLCGSFLYYEDYTELYKTREKLKTTNAQLEKNNALLQIQSEVAAERASLAAEKIVYQHIDSILGNETAKIAMLLNELTKSKNIQCIMGRINIITCAIKRKCILRISTLYKKSQSVEDFLNCIGEMKEFAALVPITITVGFRYSGKLNLVQTIAMYELFCAVIEAAAVQNCSDILVQLYDEDAKLLFSVIPDKKIDVSAIHYNPQGEIACFRQYVSVKDWYDSTAVLLTLQKKEEKND